MTITPSSLAAINGVGVRNEQFAVSAEVIAQKNVIIGTVDPLKEASLDLNEPIRIFSAEQAGALTGFGFMLHRLARAAFKGGKVETWIIPQAETGSAATGEFAITGPATAAGVLSGYIANELVTVNVANADSADALGEALADAISLNDELPVTAVNVAGTVTITSKSTGPWGDDISLAVNLGSTDALPAGVSVVITEMSGGAGVPDIQAALDSLGTGDGQNEKFFTNVIHGYGWDTGTLDDLSNYNGAGNTFIGNYKKEVARPFRSLIGDVNAGLEYGLSDLLDAADLRRLDRTNGVIAVPGSYSHPQEIAAQAIGLIAVTNSIRAEEGYIDKVLTGVSIGAIADRWTNDYDNRDQAVKGGVGTTLVKNGVVTLQNVITFYRPEDVAPESNGYIRGRNISICQNMLFNFRSNFERDKWKGITIVEDVTAVANVTSRQKARDVDSVIDDLLALADQFAANAWIYSAEYTKNNLSVTLRPGLSGFDITFPVILSGEGGIYNSEIVFDTSIAVLTAGGE